MLILIAILAIPQLWAAFKNKDVLDSAYYRAPSSVRMHYAVQYLVLASLLAIMAFETYEAGTDRFPLCSS